MSYLRGGIRRAAWMKHPVKLEFIKNNRQRIPNPNPKGKAAEVWGGKCNVCKNLFVQSQLVVDHIREFSASLKDIKDIQSFVELISLVTEDDLQFVCKDCHEKIHFEGIVFFKGLKANFGVLNFCQHCKQYHQDGISVLCNICKTKNVKYYPYVCNV